MTFSRRAFIASTAALALPLPALAAPGPRWYDAGSGLAASGRDVVAYFNLSSRADGVMGSAEHMAVHKGITFHFKDAANLARFEADPDAYTPRFGGHCAFAMARGYFASGDPDAWTVHEGELFLNVSKIIRTRWLISKRSEIANGKENWSGFYPGEA